MPKKSSKLAKKSGRASRKKQPKVGSVKNPRPVSRYDGFNVSNRSATEFDEFSESEFGFQSLLNKSPQRKFGIVEAEGCVLNKSNNTCNKKVCVWNKGNKTCVPNCSKVDEYSCEKLSEFCELKGTKCVGKLPDKRKPKLQTSVKKMPVSLMANIHKHRSASAKPASAKPASAKPASAKPASAEPASAEPASAKPASAKPASAKPTRKMPVALMANIQKHRSASNRSSTVKPASVKSTSAKQASVKANTPIKRPKNMALLLEIGDKEKGMKLLKRVNRDSNKFKKELEKYRDLVRTTINSVNSDDDQTTTEKKRIINFVDKIRVERENPTEKNILKYRATVVRYVAEYLKHLEKKNKLSPSLKASVLEALNNLIKSDTDSNMSVIYFGLKTKSISKLIKKKEGNNSNSNSDWNSISQSEKTSGNSDVNINVSAVSATENN